ncbi:MAG: TIGR03936 family radical SAM-associated protein [Oscillospiraceae bacterium]|nr:TIGR03936 family radical SAM-associated protein [Oscillospiraceae bacterium]
MTAIRVFYAKTGRAKYLSHLDTMRTLTRALRRSRLPLWHTEGFNPHLYITFALPLPLGHEGLRETFDVRLTAGIEPAEAALRMRAAMPDGFEILEAAPPVMQPKEIAWADYCVRVFYGGDIVNHARESFDSFNAQPQINTLKRTKKGDVEIDIKPLAQVISAKIEGDALSLELRMAAGINLNLNPDLYLKAFHTRAGIEPERVQIARTAVLTGNLENFR